MRDIEIAARPTVVGRQVVIMTNGKEYYFSTRHVMVDDNDELVDYNGFVPITAYLPSRVVPRPSLPDGIVDTVAKMLMIFHPDEKEIENPFPKYRVPGL